MVATSVKIRYEGSGSYVKVGGYHSAKRDLPFEELPNHGEAKFTLRFNVFRHTSFLLLPSTSVRGELEFTLQLCITTTFA